jgi:hypothetical protein
MLAAVLEVFVLSLFLQAKNRRKAEANNKE